MNIVEYLCKCFKFLVKVLNIILRVHLNMYISYNRNMHRKIRCAASQKTGSTYTRVV